MRSGWRGRWSTASSSIASEAPSPPPSGPIHKRTIGTPGTLGVPVAVFDPGAVLPAETHVERGPLDRQQVLELIRERLADILEIGPETINEASSFSEDLDADSLALIELVEALEEELGERTVGFRINDEDLEDLKTVGDAVDYVVTRLGQASCPS